MKNVKSILLGISGGGKTWGASQYLAYQLRPTLPTGSTRMFASYSFELDRDIRMGMMDTIGDLRNRTEEYLVKGVFTGKGLDTVYNFVLDGTRIDESIRYIDGCLTDLLERGLVPSQVQTLSINPESPESYPSEFVKDGVIDVTEQQRLIKSQNMIRRAIAPIPGYMNAVKTFKVTKGFVEGSELNLDEVEAGVYNEKIESLFDMARRKGIYAGVVGDSGDYNNNVMPKYFAIYGPNGPLETPVLLNSSICDAELGTLIYLNETKKIDAGKYPILDKLY